MTVDHDLYAVVQPTGQVWHSPDGGESWTSRGLVYTGDDHIAVDAVITDLDGRLWASVSGAGLTAERHGVYRTVEPVISTDPEPATVPPVLEVWPHPVRGQATLSFTLSVPGAVRLAVYDLLGRRAAVPFDDFAGTGEVSVPLDLSALPAGLYVLRLEAPEAVVSRVLSVVR